MMERFAVSWLDKLRQDDRTAPISDTTMGWRYEDGELTGFVYGNTFYQQDGEETPTFPATDDEFYQWYLPTGKREVWLKAAKLLTDRKRPELDIILSVPFAGPLTVFAGALYGAVISIWGKPGMSKSTAQQVAAAVWGHPKQTRESLNSTPRSIQGRLGRTRNLPAYWDDVQDRRHQQALFETMFVAAEGAEGGRLLPNAGYKKRMEWQTLLVACSNVSFVEYLARKQKSTTAGMRRVFEFEYKKRKEIDPGIIDATDASQMFAELEHNYGAIGAEYAKILATEHKEIKELVSNTIKRFREKVQGVEEESYWFGVCGVLIVGAAMAQRLGVNVDVTAMEKFLFDAFVQNRSVRHVHWFDGGTRENTWNILAEFVHIYADNTLVVDRPYKIRFDQIKVLAPPKSKPIFIQVMRDARTILIHRPAMRAFIQSKNIEHLPVFQGLRDHFSAREVNRHLGASTEYAQIQEWCFEIVVPPGQCAFLENLLHAHGEPEKLTPPTARGAIEIKDGKWISRIMRKGKKHHLGTFATAEEAHEAYCDAAKGRIRAGKGPGRPRKRLLVPRLPQPE